MKKLLNKILVVVILTLAYLGYQYPLEFDVTHKKINSLSEPSLTLLTKLQKPLVVELFTSDRKISDHVLPIIQLFQKQKKEITIQVHYNQLDPAEKANLKLYTNHNLLLTYEDRKKAVDINPSSFGEGTFANLIQQIIQDKDLWIVFLAGHGEQNPLGQENRNLSLLTAELKSKGFQVIPLNLGETGVIPDNTQILVIADSKTSWLPQETATVLEYIKRGGNLLWLISPHTTPSLNKLSKVLGIKYLNKTILDRKAHAMGAPTPVISIVTQYPDHAITNKLDMLTVFPWATPIQYQPATQLEWEVKPLLMTNATTTLEGDKDKLKGPFPIGITLTRAKQRIAIIGNSHFLSNASIHNYGNLALASHIFNWLSEASPLIVPSPTSATSAIDIAFMQNETSQLMIQYLFPYGLSLGYLWIGWYIKRSREQKHRCL